MRKLKLFLSLLMLMCLSVGNVWAETWNKVTSAPSDWSGEYLLVYETSATAGVAWTGVDATGCSVAVTISSGVISTKPNNAVSIVVASMTGGYSLKVSGGTNNNKYLSGTSGSNKTNFDASASANTLSYDASNKCVSITSNTSVMRYNSSSNNGNWFRYYKSTSYTNQKAVQLYKKTGSQKPTYSIEPAVNHDGWGTATLNGSVITAEPASGYRYASPAYTVTEGTATVSQDGDEFTVTPESDCTVRINFEAIPTYTVTLKDNNSSLTQETGGASVTLPSRANCTSKGYTFAGWTKSWTSTITEATTTAPTIIPAGSYTPEGDENLYPVYTKTEDGSNTGAEIGTTMWAENFSGFAKDDYPDGSISNSHTGTTVYNNGSVTYTVTAGTDSRPKIFDDSGSGTDGNNMLIYKKNGYFTIEGIAVGGASTLTLSFTKGGSGVLAVSGSDNITVSGSTTGSTITVNSGTTFDLKFQNTNNRNNLRLDDISVVVATTNNNSTTYYLSDPNCCTELGAIGGTISWAANGNNLVASGWNATTGGNEDGYLVKLYNSDKSQVLDSHNTGSKDTKTHTFTSLGAGTYWVSVTPTYSGAGNYCAAGDETFSAASVELSGNVIVTFKLNGGTVEGDAEKTQEVEFNKATNLTSFATLGYVAPTCKQFGGWAASEEDANAATPVVFKADGATINVSEATNLWAIWNTKTFAVTDGTIDASVASHSFSNTVACGSDLTITCAAAAAYKGNPTVTATGTHGEITVNSATSVTIANVQSAIAVSIAYPTPKEIYVITWNVNGSALSGAALAGATTSVYEGDAIENLPANPSGLACKNTFKGWSTKDSKTIPQTTAYYDDLFTAASGAPAISKPTTFYAVFGSASAPSTNLFSWDGGAKADLEALDEVEANGLGSDYAGSHAPYLVKFDGTGDYIDITTEGAIASVSVGIKLASGAPTSTSSITVKESTNGTTFTDVETLDISGKQNAILDLSTTQSFASTSRRVRLYFTKGGVNVGVGPISITGVPTPDLLTECAAVEAPTFDVEEGTYNAAQTVKISNHDNDYMYFYTTDGTDPAADANLDPTGTSAEYDDNDGITIDKSCTLKVIAYNDEVVASAITSAAYVLQVATPTISGTTAFLENAEVTIEATGADAIYYTDDNSDPASSDTKKTYSGSFPVESTKTIKAIAVKAGWTSSEIASQAFTKITPKTVAEANTAIAALSANGTIANQYVKGLISQIDKFNEDNTITYYISDNGTTASQLQVYHGSAGVANNGNAFTAKENLQLGEEVIVSGTLKKFEKSTNNYVYEFDKPNSIVAYKTHSPIAWSANAYTAELGGSENEFPTLSGTTGLTISYSSSDETVATISADGTTYDLKKTGETTITATSAATDDFVATTKSYTLTVSPTVIRVDLDIDCNGATSGCPETTHLVKQTSLPNPLPEVTKTGKNFGGWYTDNTFETPAVAGASITENTTIYAQWLEPYTVAEALTMIAALGNDEKTAENVYVAGVVTADAVSIDNKTATYKIKDATVNNSLEVYKGKGLNNADVAAGDLQEGDQVVVYGQLMKYKGYSSTTKPEIVDPNYLYSFTRPTFDVTGVTVASSANVRAGKTITLKATIEPANASDKAVTWSSDAEGVATVDENGVVTGVAEGTAHITVTTHDGGLQATCTVTVAGALPTFTEDDHEWIKITNASKLVAGRFYVIASETKGKTATVNISNSRLAEVATTFADGIIASDKLGANTAIFELGGTEDNWTLYEVNTEKYLSGTTASLSWSDDVTTTAIAIAEGDATIGSSTRILHNVNSKWFATYSSNTNASMLLPQLYMWAELSHSVTFDANGGVAESVPGVERTDEGKIIIPATEPTHSDITKAFGGWYKSDAPAVLYNAGDEFETNVDVTLYAKWNTVPTYTVTYSANGGTGTAPAEPATVQAGTTITVVENTGYTKPGFVYAGWQVVYNDGENDHIITPDEESKFTMVAYNVTIKALWEEPSNQKWVRVESTDELDTENGTNYIIVGASSDVAMGAKGSGNFYTSVGIVKTGNYLNGPESMTKVTLEAGSGEGKFAIKHGTQYIYSENAKNIGEKNDASDWTITITNGVATIKTGTGDGWYLKYNSTQPRFNTYASGQQAVAIYREKALTPIDHDGMTEADVNTYDDVEIGKDKTWTVSDDIEVGDVYMKEGSVIANSAEVKANDLYFKTKTGKSNQIYDASQLNVIGDLYYDVQLCDGDLDANYWYSIAVPFDVDLNSGVFLADGTQLTNRSDFEVWGYNTTKRAQTQANGWERVSDNMMHAGKAYLIGFNPDQPNIIRLKAAAGWKTNLFNGTSMQVVAAGSGDHANWNGLANPTMRYIDVNKKTSVFNNNTHNWDSYDPAALQFNFVVGTAFFVQSADPIAISNTDHHNEYRAPKRENDGECAYAVRITREDATSFDNQIIVRASEEATGTYTQGHDMLTMNGTSSNTAALLWTENYGGKRLAIEEAAWLNDQASYALNMYAPKAGTYSISVAETKDNADLYLTQDGAIIWNLSMSAYELSLNKGLTSNYGLLLIKKAPGIATGVDEISGEKAGVQKIVIEDKVFILRGGKMYDVTGKAVK